MNPYDIKCGETEENMRLGSWTNMFRKSSKWADMLGCILSGG